MDDDTRNSLEIEKIFPSQNEDAKILYVQCSNSDEAAKITAHAKNISTSNLKESEAAIAIHIPKILYNRYLALEKLMYQLRHSAFGKIQTNIRLGKSDFMVRQRMKGDFRKWKEIPPLEIPNHICQPNLELLKNKNKKQEQQIEDLYNIDDNEMNENENENDNENIEN